MSTSGFYKIICDSFAKQIRLQEMFYHTNIYVHKHFTCIKNLSFVDKNGRWGKWTTKIKSITVTIRNCLQGFLSDTDRHILPIPPRIAHNWNLKVFKITHFTRPLTLLYCDCTKLTDVAVLIERLLKNMAAPSNSQGQATHEFYKKGTVAINWSYLK